MTEKELIEAARILQRDLRHCKEINPPLYDYELYRTVKWLRDEAGWHVQVQVMLNGVRNGYFARSYEIEANGEVLEVCDTDGQRQSDRCEEALEAAIHTTLTHIINSKTEDK